MGKYTEQAETEMKEAQRGGRAFLQWEALRQIALNLARIADSMEEGSTVAYPYFLEDLLDEQDELS